MRRMTIAIDPPPRARAQRRAWVRPSWWRPAARTAKVALLLGLGVGLPAAGWQSGVLAQAADRLQAEALRASALAGLTVADVFVEGRFRTPREDLLAALDVDRGDPILAIDLAEAKARIEALPWVREAAVERRLPGVLHVHLDERQPVALWQKNGRYVLVDSEGATIRTDVSAFVHLPLVVGDDAPAHAAALVAALAGEPGLMTRVKAAVRVGGRRWDLLMDDVESGITVRMPEEGFAEAWSRLARLERDQALLERRVTSIDMRLPDRLVVGLEHGAARPAGAKPGKDA